MKLHRLFETFFSYVLVPLVLVTTGESAFGQNNQVGIDNDLIDTPKFLQDVTESHRIRASHRVTEDEFIEMAKDPDTIILDARNEERFAGLHIVGAKNLSFTEFTAASLASVIPSKNTRILIYCNNNIRNSPIAFATKVAEAALNLSTYPSLYSYGYRNVYELGPAIEIATSKIQFEGNMVRETSEFQQLRR